MSDTLYLYQGPLTGVTLNDGREVMLYPDREVSLPADNQYVKTLVALDRLTPVPSPPPPKKPVALVKEKEAAHVG